MYEKIDQKNRTSKEKYDSVSPFCGKNFTAEFNQTISKKFSDFIFDFLI